MICSMITTAALNGDSGSRCRTLPVRTDSRFFRRHRQGARSFAPSRLPDYEPVTRYDHKAQVGFGEAEVLPSESRDHEP